MLTQVQQQNTAGYADFLVSCTPMLPGTQWHMHRGDFENIADKAGADALRFFEMQTNYRIRDLRGEYGIPLSHWPHEDDLWIDASCRTIEAETLHARSKSKFAQCLTDEHIERPSGDIVTKSLVQLGFLSRHRVIARQRDKDALWSPKATRYLDIKGEFIFVLDDRGNYIGDDGSQCNAVCDGGVVIRQYRYEIDAVNRALYARKFWESPKPLERWPSTIRRSDAMMQREAPAAETTTSIAADAARNEKALLSAGVSMPPTEYTVPVSHSKNNTAPYSVSRESTAAILYDMDTLRTAEWCAETLIGLVSSVLQVPVCDNVDEDDWCTEWAKPAERLLHKTAHMTPVDAWRHIEAIVRFMLSEESWFSRPYQGDPKVARAKKTPITLKHLANNLEAQHAAMLAAHWVPSQTTPYDGPPPVDEDYSAGYRGNESPREASPVVESPQEIEVVADGDLPGDTVAGMDSEELSQLYAQIVEDYPDSTLLVGTVPVAPGLSILFIEYALKCYLDFRSLHEWQHMPPESLLIIEQRAIPYAVLNAQGPPGSDDDGQESEASP